MSVAAFAAPVQTDAATVSMEAPSPESAGSLTRYTLAPEGSLLGVVVYYKRGGLLSRFAHDHVLVASRFDGDVVWDSDDVSRCEIAIAVPLNALVVDPGQSRTIVGIDPKDTVGEGSKQQILVNAFSEKQMHAAKFPDVRFDSTSCEAAENGVLVKGALTIRGLSVPVRVLAEVTADGERFEAKGSFDLNHKSLGFRPYSNGLLSNDDPLRFVLDLKGSVPTAP